MITLYYRIIKTYYIPFFFNFSNLAVSSSKSGTVSLEELSFPGGDGKLGRSLVFLEDEEGTEGKLGKFVVFVLGGGEGKLGTEEDPLEGGEGKFGIEDVLVKFGGGFGKFGIELLEEGGVGKFGMELLEEGGVGKFAL